jgi:hypothetical protein
MTVKEGAVTVIGDRGLTGRERVADKRRWPFHVSGTATFIAAV